MFSSDRYEQWRVRAKDPSPKFTKWLDKKLEESAKIEVLVFDGRIQAVTCYTDLTDRPTTELFDSDFATYILSKEMAMRRKVYKPVIIDDNFHEDYGETTRS